MNSSAPEPLPLPPPPDDIERRAGEVRRLESPARGPAARSAVQLMFASWLAYKLELGSELRMVPRQWEMVDYFGDGAWSLRRFPFDTLQSVVIQGDSQLPRLEVRIAPGGEERAEVLLSFVGGRSGDLELPRDCILHSGGLDSLEPALKDILPAFLEVWARSAAEHDFSHLYDWALEKDISPEPAGEEPKSV